MQTRSLLAACNTMIPVGPGYEYWWEHVWHAAVYMMERCPSWQRTINMAFDALSPVLHNLYPYWLQWLARLLSFKRPLLSVDVSVCDSVPCLCVGNFDAKCLGN